MSSIAVPAVERRLKKDSRDSSNPYGVLTFISWAHPWNNQFYGDDAKVERAAALMKEAGIGFARADFLWSDLEPQEGDFDFAHQDRVINILARHGIKLLGTLNYNPLWRKVEWNTAPDRDAFIRYAREVVRHFKDRVKYWEIWNEPDHATYWMPQDGLKAYSELLKRLYPVLKKTDPTSAVLMGGLSNSVTHLPRLYEQAGKDSFDIVNLHIFVNPLMKEASSTLHHIYTEAMKTMQDFQDDDKSIWVTEVGCPGTNVADGGWWLGAVPNEAQQAAWLETVYREGLDWKGVEKIFWAFFRDTDHHFNNDIDRLGLLHLDFSPKPSYLSYKKIATKKS